MRTPPFEYGPVGAAPPGELTGVGPAGTVVSWSWMPEPLAGQPTLPRPFGWALIRLDGADTTMLHAVDAPGMAPRRQAHADRDCGPGPVGGRAGWAASGTSPASSRATPLRQRRTACGAGPRGPGQ